MQGAGLVHVKRFSADQRRKWMLGGSRQADIGLSGKGNSNSHGACPVHENDLDDQVDSDQ